MNTTREDLALLSRALPTDGHQGSCGLGRGMRYCDCGADKRAEAHSALARVAAKLEETNSILFARATHVAALEGELARLRDGLRRMVFIAEHLFQMIDRDTWRATGGDDMQGHYEGEYHAEKVQEEIASYRALLSGSQDTKETA